MSSWIAALSANRSSGKVSVRNRIRTWPVSVALADASDCALTLAVETISVGAPAPAPIGRWAIGAGEEYADLNYQDQVESRAIYDLLEEELVPTYYTRGSDGVPREWVKRMKRSINTNVPLFNTNRMVQEYVEVGYWPSAGRHLRLTADH